MRGPNMSYCMCENTLGALEQVLESLRGSADLIEEKGPEVFFSKMSTYERKAFQNLILACQEMVALNDEFLIED